jgi:hypothetical protein
MSSQPHTPPLNSQQAQAQAQAQAQQYSAPPESFYDEPPHRFYGLPAGYGGPHLRLPLTAAQVSALLLAFRGGAQLHYKYVVALLSAYRRYAADLPTLVEVEVAQGTTVTVCGDTHGQLQDLFSIYSINGPPSPTNRYLMNGDFVDRGANSVELALTLMAWALLYPGELRTSRGAACMLNRGNHECHNQNMTQGFMHEVLLKYSGALAGAEYVETVGNEELSAINQDEPFAGAAHRVLDFEKFEHRCNRVGRTGQAAGPASVFVFPNFAAPNTTSGSAQGPAMGDKSCWRRRVR